MLLDGALLLLLALTFVPVAVLLIEVLCSLLPPRSFPLPAADRPRLAVVVPAHNESTGILDTLNSVLSQLVESDRLLVVADNCTDNTARVALDCGAEVIERKDDMLRGKGYALDFGVRHLAQDSRGRIPDAVIVVDADCLVAPGALERIARLSVASGRPVQAMYHMKAPPSAGPGAALAELAWIVKNKVRPLGAHNLGLPCQLMGAGMAFTWRSALAAELATGHLVEDLTMGLAFARAGTPALYCPEAVVTSFFPTTEEGSRTQRTRWEHGHISVIVHDVPRLLLDGMRRGDARTIALALDACVPPLALLSLIILSLAALAALNALLYASLIPLCVAAMVVLMFSTALTLAWWRYGRETVSLSELPHALFYVLRKIPLYLAFAVRRQKEWIRSKRDAS